MNARTATPGRPAECGAEGRRAKPLGRLLVSDYVGQPAVVAAQAIRRTGLRPGLERSLDCSPELLGQVVAQDPSAGSELARNAMVTLYVAAPAAVAAEESPDLQPTRDAAVSPRAAAHASLSAGGVQHAKLRRRKPRPPETPSRLDTTPAPAGLDANSALALPDGRPVEEWISQDEVASPAAPDDRELFDGVPDDEPTEDLSHDEFVLHADDVFAGRAGVPWRRVYPAGRRLTSYRNQRQRRWRR
jgi:PASTA domain